MKDHLESMTREVEATNGGISLNAHATIFLTFVFACRYGYLFHQCDVYVVRCHNYILLLLVVACVRKNFLGS